MIHSLNEIVISTKLGPIQAFLERSRCFTSMHALLRPILNAPFSFMPPHPHIGAPCHAFSPERTDSIITQPPPSRPCLQAARGLSISEDTLISGTVHVREDSLLKGWRERWAVVRSNFCLYVYRKPEDVAALSCVLTSSSSDSNSLLTRIRE